MVVFNLNLPFPVMTLPFEPCKEVMLDIAF